MGKDSQSPVPARKPIEMSFNDAIKAVMGGKKIRRLEWSDEDEYGVLRDSYLMIHRNKKFHTWIVSEGDLLAIDWVVKK